MTTRQILFGLMMMFVMCATATAKPPMNTLPEGRELDPVTRDHFLATPAAKEESVPARPVERRMNSANELFFSSLREAIIGLLTIPLGTVQSANIEQ